MEEKNNIQDKTIEKVEEKIMSILEDDITPDNLDNLGKLVDIHKDIKNEKYWKIKEEKYMRYGNYDRGSYNRGSYGRDEYGEGSYGRRGVKGTGRGRYRGEDMLDEMYQNYNEYNESGNYGGDTTKSLEYMMQAVYDFVCMLSDEAQSPEEMQIIKRYSRKISEM